MSSEFAGSFPPQVPEIMPAKSSALVYSGVNSFRQLIVLSTLTGRTVKMVEIRPFDDDPGLADFEERFLHLIEALSSGCKISISQTGTQVIFRPGLLQGGSLSFDCGLGRSVGYYLEGLCYLAPFVKQSLDIRLQGITNDKHDVSVDSLKLAWLPVLRRFLPNDEGLAIEIRKRGLRPSGGGEVHFSSPICRQLKAVQLTKEGKLKKIRGVAFVCKTSPLMANRMIDSVKEILRDLLPDVFVYSQQRKGAAGGNSPGYGICLNAETSEGVVYCGEAISNEAGHDPITPEDVGKLAAKNLLVEIYRGGCVDSSALSLASLWMALSPKDVSKLHSCLLTDYSVDFLRHIRDFCQVTFKIDHLRDESKQNGVNEEGAKLSLTCVGAGFTNLNKKMI